MHKNPRGWTFRGARDLVVMVNAGNYSDFSNLLALRDDYIGRYVIPAVMGD